MRVHIKSHNCASCWNELQESFISSLIHGPWGLGGDTKDGELYSVQPHTWSFVPREARIYLRRKQSRVYTPHFTRNGWHGFDFVVSEMKDGRIVRKGNGPFNVILYLCGQVKVRGEKRGGLRCSLWWDETLDGWMDGWIGRFFYRYCLH